MIRESHTIEQGSALLKKLQAVMVSEGLWSEQIPSAAALGSRQPFACDTLSFEQWLQFIFIPRLHEMLSRGEMAPPMNILAMAQMTWSGDNLNVQRVLGELDNWSDCVHGK